MIGKRVISAIVGIAILTVILIVDKIFINIGAAVISTIALCELLSLIGVSGKKVVYVISISGVILISFSDYFNADIKVLLSFVFISALFIVLLMEYKSLLFSQIASACIAIIYTAYFTSFIIHTRNLPYGSILVWLFFIGAWTTDSAAYFVGMSFGKNKLCPDISPKKTVEGAIGGVLGCVLSFILFGIIIEYIVKINININYLSLIILGFLCSISSQFGDLIASIIKRQYGAKDFGNIMPGHGGVLDRFDSILFTAPLVYFYLLYFKIF